MKHYYTQVEDVLAQLETAPEGLTGAAAGERLAQHGPNKPSAADKPSPYAPTPYAPVPYAPVPWYISYARHLSDPMIVILIAAAAISAATGTLDGVGLAEAAAVLVLVLAKAAGMTVWESKAAHAAGSMEHVVQKARVLRDGVVVEVSAEELVPGDVVRLKAGDNVLADGRIIDAEDLSIGEYELTGEATASAKVHEALAAQEEDLPLFARSNMCFAGTTVERGRCNFVVTATGSATEAAAKAAPAPIERTPLQAKLADISRMSTLGVLAICSFIFLHRFLMHWVGGNYTPQVWLESVMIALSLAVAVMPETMMIIAALAMCLGALNMAKLKVLTRRLAAAELLGCAQVICVDKAGLLTSDRKVVDEVESGDEQMFAAAVALCSDVYVGEDGSVSGEAAEAALAEYALTLGQNRSHLEPLFARLYTLPADNGRMRMTTVHLNDGRVMQFTKGAPEQVLALCTHILTDGEEFELTDEDAENLLTRIQLMAGQGKSVLAAAFKEYAYEFPEEIEAALESGADALECDMTFIGIAGMTNAVRPEAAAAIAACKAAGITPVMITGEHKDTAVAIARQLELVSDASQAMTGGEISAIDRLEYEERLESIGVYARVAPGGKAGIVGAWRRKGYVCAVTGIGVHDAPSLQSADIGIGLGANSADAVNNNAGIVLADTGFENVVAAVGEGRRIYDNVRRTALFLLTSNLAQVLAVFLATVFGFVILRPGHLLWISLVPGAVVAAALALEQAEAGIMNRPPRNPGESFFAGGAGTAVLWHGVAGAVPAFAAYIAGSFFEHGLVSFDRSVTGITMAFLTFSVYQCLLALNIGGKRGSMAAVLQHNKHLRTAVAASLILALLLIYAPGVNGFAGFVPLMPAGLAVSIVLGALVVPVSSVLRTRV